MIYQLKIDEQLNENHKDGDNFPEIDDNFLNELLSDQIKENEILYSTSKIKENSTSKKSVKNVINNNNDNTNNNFNNNTYVGSTNSNIKSINNNFYHIDQSRNNFSSSNNSYFNDNSKNQTLKNSFNRNANTAINTYEKVICNDI